MGDLNSMLPTSRWLTAASEDALDKVSANDLVMAWARDRNTGEPRYIGELGEDQRNSCECISCSHPLTAVNAGKKTFIKRPHFRHPAGTEKKSCHVLSARFAALNILRDEGVLELPRRRQSGGVTGLSGQYYDAWVEMAPELVRISNFSFCDKVSAILTLDDGRTLKVCLVGSVDSSTNHPGEQMSLMPTIHLIVDDPSIAAMPPEDLKKRLRIIMDDGVWCSHWEDDSLLAEANKAARLEAEKSLDWLDDNVNFPADISAEIKRETLLHIKAKEILEREKRILLPSLVVEVEVGLPHDAPLTRSSSRPEQVVMLESVALEKKIGRIKPDVVAKSIASSEWPAEQILIEITVTNIISEERRERIRRENQPTIEIDISRMGGVVTEAEFTRLVVDESAGKRWLHHPDTAREMMRLQRELESEVATIIEQQKNEAEAKKISTTEWACRYLDSFVDYVNLQDYQDDSGSDSRQLDAALNRARECADGLSLHGYPEANELLFSRHQAILCRLISLKLDKAVGYKFNTAWQVINAILQERQPYNKWQTLYLIGIKVWRPTLNQMQADKVAIWREEVMRSLVAGEQTFQRDRRYDRFLGLLFPDLAIALAKPLVKAAPVWYPPADTVPRVAYRSNNFQRDTNLWLQGQALENWRMLNPEYAKWWDEKK